MHRHLCVRVAENHELVGIFHPSPLAPPRMSRMRSIRSKAKNRGAAALILERMSRTSTLHAGWDRKRSVQRAQEQFFADAHSRYGREVEHLACDVDDINSPDAIRQLRACEPDVVICLGGPIYRAPLIDACKLMLNYHTGISPIYNGAGTIFWTFANKHVHLSGGTLMTMSNVVDGGDVLAHYLCPIEAQDDPGTLFMKAIVGATKVYDSFLAHLSAAGDYVGIAQTKSFFDYRSFDWMTCQDVAVQRNIDRGICRQHERPEQIIEYWRLDSAAAAQQALKDNVARWVADV